MKKSIRTPLVPGLILLLAGLVSAQLWVPNKPAVFDFDGDHISDLVAIEKVDSNLIWYILQSSDGLRKEVFGLADANDIAVPADYDGDGKWDVAIWRPGSGSSFWPQAYFWILSSKGDHVMVVPWGITGDNPRVTQDFDGDGAADPAVVRRDAGTMTWWILKSSGGYDVARFGTDTDYFLRGDYDGDGRADLAVYRTTKDEMVAANTFIIRRSSTGKLLFSTFGLRGDLIVPGDFDGDGVYDIAVFRNTPTKGDDNSYWYWQRSYDGGVAIVPFGLNREMPGVMDCPAPGDYDNDGAADVALWRMILSNKADSEFHYMSEKEGHKAFPFGMSYMEVPNFTLQVVDTNYPQ